MIMIFDIWTRMNESCILLTISNVRAMDGIMNCVDYKFTLSAKSNIFAVISFSSADTLISI